MISTSDIEMVADSSTILPDHQIGSRIECCGSYGTIKYIGSIEGYPGIWLGVDWDDLARGKHNGWVNGVRYFETRHPKSGSFVRREKVNFGQSVTSGIIGVYGNVTAIDLTEQQKNSFQRVTKAPFLEMVGFDKVAKKQSDYEALQVVNIRNQQVSTPGTPMEIRNICPNIKELDLSKNLFWLWSDVFDICAQLQHLRWLNVSENCLKLPDDFLDHRYPNVKTLICGYMNLVWDEVNKISIVFNCVEELRLPYNNITNIDVPQGRQWDCLKNLDLEGNVLCWCELLNLSSFCPNLNEMNLDKIELPSIEFSGNAEKVETFSNLRKLHLKNNLINDWKSIGELNRLKNFEHLRFKRNPVLERENSSTNMQLILAKIGNLKVLNGAEIKPEDRRGAEYDYIKKYGLEWLTIKDTPKSSEFLKEHTRYLELVEKYGNPEESELRVQTNVLNDALLHLSICFNGKEIKKKLPPTLLVQKLIMLVQKMFKLRERPVLIYRSEQNGAEFVFDDEMKEIGYYCMQEGDKIIVQVAE